MSSNRLENKPFDPEKLPRHVAIIMDGNGRWAKKRLLNRVKGHEKGAETVRTIVRTCRELQIPILTLYAFSTENWQRPATEVKALMQLLKRFLLSECREMIQNNIRLRTIGQITQLPEDVRRVLHDTMAATATNTGLILNLALNYGGRREIADMVRRIAEKVASKTLRVGEINEELIADHLYTCGLPDPDIMIRTSGEMRISNFLLWQLAYTELFVTPILWPDFSAEAFIEILKLYQQRDRRYGKVKA